jgi:hypothetical protein
MEVGKMPAERKTNQSTRLTAAGLIAVTAATLLMMAWAIFPTAAFADGTITWTGQGSDKLPCTGETHWILSNADDITSATLTVNGTNYTMVQQGNGSAYEAFVPGPLAQPVTASVSYQGDASMNPQGQITTQLVISSCTPGQTTTTTTTTTTVPTTTTTVPTTTTTVPTTTTTVPTTTTTVPTTTTTVPGGGGGGATTTVPTTTTTTTVPTVGPTTIHKSTTTTDEVLPTTVRPGGTAFTGVENVVPIGAIALMLMTSGSGLLWAGARRRRHDGSEDED